MKGTRTMRLPGSVRGSNLVRLIGLLAIVALLPYESPPAVPASAADWLFANSLVLLGVLPLIGFLWLYISGSFGYGSPRREDWPALLVFLLALGTREGYARHGIEELEIYFYYGVFPNRHSVVHPLLEMFVQPLGRDPYRFMMHVNGIMGSLAALPLYLFVRQRTQSDTTAVLVATFYAVHPVLVQMAPTDGHNALLLFSWFSGLALLTAEHIGPRQMFAGATLLGIAATSRAEGVLYLVAALLLLDLRAVLAAVRRHVAAAVVSCAVVLALVAVQVYAVFPAHIPHGHQLPSIAPFTLSDVLRTGLLSEDFNDRIFVALVAVGLLAGLVNKRLRIGLGAALGTLVVGWPVSMATDIGFLILHRLVAVCALQVIAAGVGAAWITSWLPSRHRWAAATPALAVALYVFARHHQEIRAPNAVTDEFWMLRNQLAPSGVVKTECTLLSVGSTMDTDIHDFSQVLPGMTFTHCEQEDCVRLVAEGGCFYYLRSLNCYLVEGGTPPACREHGRTPAGDVFPCLHPRCAQLEQDLELATVEERTVDTRPVFPPSRPRWVDIGLYRVLGVKD
jgi:hypothetical protein